MKTILLPTDFSLAAKNAARYAMHLAKEMRANLKLCNAVMLPVEIPLAGHVSVPIVAIETLEHDTEEKLKHLAEKMSELDQLETANDTYHPLVAYGAETGSVTGVVKSFMTDHNISLVVMGTKGAGGLSQFLLGSSSRAMVEAATFPVLFVPPEASYNKIIKIAFATDLSKQDIAVIHVLASFARTFNAEILLVHISNQLPDSQMSSKKKIDEFLNEITNNVNYHKIYYQHVLDEIVDEGLDWLSKYGQIQMLAMVHRKHDLLYRLFNGSRTQKLRRKIDIPLLVFPPDCLNKVL
ncbi:universal stress protein [Pedobacter nyackensis]|uniref:universal stress protein n=1 Tax=Pedobacter nyackensis TaxID=475255 RepID=UPI002930DD2F|nr:universal stress protein [Pedobacter nyackensis]